MDTYMNNKITGITTFGKGIDLPKNNMTAVYFKEGGPTVVAAWSKDEGTKERKLMLALAYPDGKGNHDVSPIREYAPSKLTSEKALADLANMDGVDSEDIKGIFEAIQKTMPVLMVERMGEGKCSIRQAYKELSGYVRQYMEPGKVFIDAEDKRYGNILAPYLQTVIDKLELGYNRLELQKNFRAWGLLRVNNGTGHSYTYKIGSGWYFSFKLSKEEKGGEAA